MKACINLLLDNCQKQRAAGWPQTLVIINPTASVGPMVVGCIEPRKHDDNTPESILNRIVLCLQAYYDADVEITAAKSVYEEGLAVGFTVLVKSLGNNYTEELLIETSTIF
jgi:hypothetical protein